MQAPLIETLVELQKRVQSIRQIPQVLLKPPPTHALLAPSVQPEFNLLKDIADSIRSESVQNALQAAAESERADRSDLNPYERRGARIRKRPRTPESPQPYVEPKDYTPFPVQEDQPLVDIQAYIRQFNATNNSRLHIWKPTRASTQQDMLRFAIQDVFTAYIVFGHGEYPTIQTVAVFGPREKVRHRVNQRSC